MNLARSLSQMSFKKGGKYKFILFVILYILYCVCIVLIPNPNEKIGCNVVIEYSISSSTFDSVAILNLDSLTLYNYYVIIIVMSKVV